MARLSRAKVKVVYQNTPSSARGYFHIFTITTTNYFAIICGSMKVCFETFGCRLNRAEALQMEAEYLADGWTLTTQHHDADLIVVRGCSVTQRAQRECERLIAHLRKKYPLKRVLTVGCLKEATDKTKLRNFEIAKFHKAATTQNEPPVPTRTARAYLKVQDGCNAACAFCIVPAFRGKSVSVAFDEVLDKAKRFIDAGYHELVVTGCNLAHYLEPGNKRLPELLAALADLSTACRVRLGSLEPSPVAQDVVDVMAAHDNICRFLHVPIQSGSNRILTAMRRPYLHKDIESLVTKATRLLPGLGLGCDVMTGFPDETETDFLSTQGLLARLPFTKAHVFPYSERPGTVAATLPNAVPPEIRSTRAHALAAMMDEARGRYVKRFKGRTVQLLVEDEKTLSGWTSEYVWCQIGEERARTLTRARGGTARQIHRKDLVEVRVRDVRGHILFGDPV